MINNKYEKAKVYKIWSTQGDKIYVGSTCKEYLSQRMVSHRKDYTKWKSGNYGHTTSFDVFEEYGIKNCFIELLEAKECKSKDELRQLEGKYIRELECVNKVLPQRTIKQYREDNKERISDQYKQYREKNKDKIKQYREDNKDMIKQKFNCECGGKFTYSYKAGHLKSKKHCQYIETQIINPEVDAE